MFTAFKSVIILNQRDLESFVLHSGFHKPTVMPAFNSVFADSDEGDKETGGVGAKTKSSSE